MSAKRIVWRAVVVAIMPALGFSVGLLLLGNTLELPKSVMERLSQVVFFPVFFSTYVFITRRRAAASTLAGGRGREALEHGAPATSGRAPGTEQAARVEASTSRDRPQR